MKSKFVCLNSELYNQAFQLRKELFFKDFSNADELLKDDFEKNSYHLVIERNTIVVGTGRLTIIEDNIGVISQMAITTDFQRQGVGRKIMALLLEKCSELKVTKVILSARITALSFYENFDFEVIGKVYPSKKTGVLHQQMQLLLK